jgi:hypothetical protein
MNTTNCYRCGDVFTGYGSLCSICKQNELLKEEAEKNRALQESIHNQNMALQRQAAQQAEYARQEAIFARQEAADLARENARLIAESNISSDDAYNYGFKYITLNWSRGNNPHNLSITAGEDGLLRADWISPYQLPHLYQSFSSGISEALGLYETPGREFMEKMAYVAGQEIAKGVLPSESFALGANGVEVEGIEINTRGFAINRETQINEVTGEISYNYVPPFVDEKLNSLFADGMNQGTAELNTPELIHQRLQAIEELKNKRLQEQEEEKRLKEKEKKLREKELKVFTVLVLLIALFAYGFINYKSDKSPQIQSKARELNPLVSKFTNESYQHYRDEILSSGWSIYKRDNEIKGWGENRPYPELDYCQEDYCSASFIGSDGEKIREVGFGYCSVDRYIQCPNKPNGFQIVLRDTIISKSESDNKFLKMKFKFED